MKSNKKKKLILTVISVVLLYYLVKVFFGLGSDSDKLAEANKAFVNKDYNTAYKLFNEICDHDMAKGCSGLAYLYNSGKGVTKDREKSLKFSLRACYLGSTADCLIFGITAQTSLPNYKLVADALKKGCSQETSNNQQSCCDTYKMLKPLYSYLDSKPLPEDVWRRCKIALSIMQEYSEIEDTYSRANIPQNIRDNILSRADASLQAKENSAFSVACGLTGIYDMNIYQLRDQLRY